MKILAVRSNLKNVRDHTLIVGVYQQGGKAKLPSEASYLQPLLVPLQKDKAFSAKFKELSFIRLTKAGRASNILWLGLGKKEKLTSQKLREACVAAGSYLSNAKVPSFTLHASLVTPVDASNIQAMAESLALPLYRYSKFKQKAKVNSGIKQVSLAVSSLAELKEAKQGIERAKIYIDACNLVRDLVNDPSNVLRTDVYADLAQEIGKKHGLKTNVFKRKDLEKEGFNALLAVNKGSDQEPRLVILEHNADKKGLPTICLVGKGITFDSGGISLKPSDGMMDMKIDMTGSATVLALMTIVSQFKLPLHVVGVMAITDNMPSGKATVPGDIVKSYSGKTIEILNTDAEGRLILADAMSYAEKHFKPQLMIDFATLTGACVIALGNAGAGVMGTDQASIDKLLTLSKDSGDKIWQLPLWDDYRAEFDSDVADLKNIASNRGAGASKGGIFLNQFVSSNTPWIHFDMAGSAAIPQATALYSPRGATAACVRLVADFLLNWH